MISLATYKDYPSISEIWERSVRSTHHFLPEEYLQEIKSLLPEILPQVKIYVWRPNEGTIQGFAGVAGQKMEMLFIHPAFQGKGIGKQLTNFCIYALGVNLVDVNEQNEQAIGFYERMGYMLIGRQELDSLGRPFPILHLEFPGTKHHSGKTHKTSYTDFGEARITGNYTD